MKKLHCISLVLFLGVLCTLWSCTKEHVRNDISLEMTDEDSVEAIVDQDLLTAGGTTVNIEQEPGSSTNKSDAVAYVDQVEMQKPVLVETDAALKPGSSTVIPATTGGEPLAAEPVVPVPAGEIASADVTVTKLGPLPGGTASAADLARMAAEPAVTPGSYNAIRPPGASAIPAVTRTTVMPVSYPQHTVKSGDTLWFISKKYGCTISELAAANGLSRRSILKIGQTLIVPGAKEGASSAVPPPNAGMDPSATLAPAVTSGSGGTDSAAASSAAAIGATGTGSEGGSPAAGKISSGETETYVVQQGDSYWKIAKRHGVSASDLMSLNDTTSDKLGIGQKILVPKK